MAGAGDGGLGGCDRFGGQQMGTAVVPGLEWSLGKGWGRKGAGGLSPGARMPGGSSPEAR